MAVALCLRTHRSPLLLFLDLFTICLQDSNAVLPLPLGTKLGSQMEMIPVADELGPPLGNCLAPQCKNPVGDPSPSLHIPGAGVGGAQGKSTLCLYGNLQLNKALSPYLI